ncbi:TPA: DUF1642 domain-containing protein [Streptococcus suis]|nr:DUF1642 domain-containing protein [Streptococcus suis]
MNKQEAIEKIEMLYLDNAFTIKVKEIISQIHEPHKVVVPKFVAEWIEAAKKCHNNLSWVWFSNPASDELNAWLKNHTETFMRAWLDGYEVEQEPLYAVTDGNKLYLKEFDELNAVIIIDDIVGATDYAKRYSDKSEAQKAADELGWFVKEVE